MYRDKKNIFIKHFNYETPIDRLNTDLYNISEWLKSNKHSLNYIETKFSRWVTIISKAKIFFK